MLYVPINELPAMLEPFSVLLDLTSINERINCHAHGHKTVPVEECVLFVSNHHHHLISGNEFLSRILAQGLYELKVELEDFSGNTRYARYTTFDVGDRTTNFNLTVDGYSGDAGTKTKLTFKASPNIAAGGNLTFSCFINKPIE